VRGIRFFFFGPARVTLNPPQGNLLPGSGAQGVFFGEKPFFSAFGLAFFAFLLYNTS